MIETIFIIIFIIGVVVFLFEIIYNIGNGVRDKIDPNKKSGSTGCIIAIIISIAIIIAVIYAIYSAQDFHPDYRHL